MTENEILLALRNELQPIRDDIQEVKADVQELKNELKPMKADIQELKTDVQELKDKLQPIENDIQELKASVKRIDLCIENELRPRIQLLAENYVPAAQRYETAVHEMDDTKRDVDILKKVVADHSRKLEKVAGN